MLNRRQNMKKLRYTLILLLGVFLSLFAKRSMAQLIVTAAENLPSWNADSLVRNVLLDDGLSISNATFNGSSGPIDCNLIGKFETGSHPTNLGMNSGVIISSGGVTIAVGPNNSGQANFNSTCDQYYDEDLANIASNNTFDAAVLEFDFIPWSDTLSFRFVFGSEEYMEYAGSQFNDVFGFFVDGLNPAGGMYEHQNMALLPGTDLVVSINNVNLNNNGEYYVDNTNGETIQFDGFTIPMEVSFVVVPMTTYHIKMAICDVSDDEYDSGVFIEAQSFTTNLSYAMTIDTLLHTEIPEDYYFCADHVIEFNTITNWNYDDVAWYFGDGSKASGAEVTHVYEEEGSYTVMNVLHNPHRANDSIYLIQTIDVRRLHSEMQASVCQGGTYWWNGDPYTEPGTYTKTFTSTTHCDSIVTLHLAMQDADTTKLNVISCDSYNWNGQTLDQSGDYIAYEQTIGGCDSIVMLHLRINHSNEEYEEIIACEPFEWHGITISETNIYEFHEQNMYGCDSVVILNATVGSLANPYADLKIDGLTQIAIASGMWPGIYNYCISDSTNLKYCDMVWSCSNPDWVILPSDSPFWFKLIANTLGSATISFSAECETGCNASVTLDVYASFIGVDEFDENLISMYPNPANDKLMIKGDQLKRILIYDCYGQLLLEMETDAVDEVTLDTGNLANGMYITDITTTKGKTTKRLFISK